MSPRQESIHWSQNSLYLVLLRTFEKPRPIAAHPALPIAEWAEHLGESPDEAADRFHKDGAITWEKTEAVLADQFSRERLRELARERGLPVSGNKSSLAAALVKADREGMRSEVASLKVMRLTAYGLGLLEREPPERLSDVIEKRPLLREPVRKVLVYLGGTMAGALIGNRGEEVYQWMLAQLRALGEPEPKLAGKRSWATDSATLPEGVDALSWCYVPQGLFYFGTDHQDAHTHEKPLQQMRLDYGYWISRFPVTVRLFRQFVKRANYDWDRWQYQGEDDHPIRAVTWRDANAFCQWLNRYLYRQKPGGYTITLPSEAEWTKAARGGVRIPRQPVIQQGRISSSQPSFSLVTNPNSQRDHPWGNEPTQGRANTNGYSETTTPVNQFPAGQSPYGVMDMAGNVWEWTRSPWQVNYRLESDRFNESAGSYALRGTSWWTGGERPRCGVRYWHDADYWNDGYGFRLVLSPLPDR